MALMLVLGLVLYRRPASRKFLPGDLVQVRAVPVRVKGGWGYKILENGNLYIYQDQIPAIAGTHVFPSRASAQKVGDLVVRKLSQGKLPTITRRDLEELSIDLHGN